MDRDRLPPLLVALQQWITGDRIPAGIDLGVVVDELLRDGSTETAAAVGSVLARAAVRIGRDGGDVSSLEPLRDRVALELTERVRRDAEVSERSFERSLGAKMLQTLAERDCSPSELAGLLNVDITQISRAGRTLAASGEMVIEVDRRDKRRRLYRAKSRMSRYVYRDVVTSALSAVRIADVVSDLLPDRFGDYLTPRHFDAVAAAARADVDTASYEPTPVHRLDVPKAGGGERPAAALRYVDRLVYAALSEGCSPQIEAALGSTDQVLWPRGEFTEKRWVQLEGFVASIDTPYVLSVDIASFYESIRHQVLADQLLRVGSDEKVVDALRSWLGVVTGKDRGLPQGLRASDRLASIVLSPVDAELRKRRVPFVRHGDDLRVAVATPGEARDVKSLVRATLQELDLLVNDDKTRWLRQETYMEPRTDVSEAVERYFESRGELDRDLAIYHLLHALGSEEELIWDWYHGDLRVREAISRVGADLEDPRRVYFYVLNAVSPEGHRMAPVKGNAFILEPGEVKLDMSSRGRFVITGGRYNDAVYNSWKLSDDYREAEAEQTRLYKPVEGETEEAKRERLDLAAAAQRRVLDLESEGRSHLARTHPDPLVRRLTIETTWLSGPWMLEALRGLAELTPDDPWVQERLAGAEEGAAKRAEERKRFALGADILDFTAKTLAGEDVNLADVRANSRYVLLEFWASWCGPCRVEIPHMKEAYARYHEKGFEIVSFTIDNDRLDWEEASAEEELPWINLGMGEDAEAPTVYNVTGVPKNYLVDSKTGDIVAKDLRGHHLDEKLKELFD